MVVDSEYPSLHIYGLGINILQIDSHFPQKDAHLQNIEYHFSQTKNFHLHLHTNFFLIRRYGSFSKNAS